MKKTSILIYLFLFSLLGLYAQKDTPLNLSGSVKGVNEGTIYLQKFNNKIFDMVDSTIIKDGKFTFNSSVILPELYGLTLDKDKTPIYIFLENTPISIQLDTSDYYRKSIIKGSKAQERFDDFKTRSSDIKIGDFINEDPSSIVSAYVLYRNFSYRLTPQEIRDNVSLLDNSLTTTQYVTVLKELANTMETVQPGNIAPDFVSITPDGRNERFSDHIGENYILLDFWAAWCGPCRRDNPNIVAAYQKYKDKGFTVYGVSLDRNKESWLKAIQDDELTWTQVSDLAFWNSKAAALYGVRAIPSNFLIDPNGRIIARNIKGEDLQNKLEELLSNK
jgi:peroxiredoxin